MESTELREKVRVMLAAGLKQRQVAAYLGIGQATVSDHKRALVAAGRLPANASPCREVIADVVDVVAPATVVGRGRAEILVEHAQVTAAMLRSAASTFAGHVLGADEWVTDPGFRERVRAVAAGALGEALDHLERIAVDLGLDTAVAGEARS